MVALGDQGAYIEDDTNVLTYPSLIAKYAHFTFIDIGNANGVQPSLSEIQTAGGPDGGAYLRFGDFQFGVLTSDFVASEESTFLALAALQRAGGTNSGGNAASLIDLASLSTLRRYDLLFGYGSMKDFAAGLRFSYGGADQSFTPQTGDRINDPTLTDPDPTKNTRDWSQGDRRGLSQIRVIGGATVNFGGGNLLDAAIDYTNYGASFTKNGLATFNGGGGNAFGVSARMRLPITRFWTIIPQLAWRGSWFHLQEQFTIPGFGGTDPTQSVALVLDPTKGKETVEHDANMQKVDFGAAAELKASKVATFWLSVGVSIFSMGSSWSDLDTEQAPCPFDASRNCSKIDEAHSASQLVWALPYVKFGTEVTPFEWMQARIGAEKYALAASTSTSDTRNLVDPTKEAVTKNGSQSASIPGALVSQPDFNVYAGASFILMPGFGLDILVLNQIFLGNFHNGWGGRAALSYKF